MSASAPTLYSAAVLLAIAAAVFAWLLNGMSNAAKRRFRKIDKRIEDVSKYLAYVGEDTEKLRKRSAKKADIPSMETKISDAIVELLSESEEKQKARIIIK